MVRPPGTGTQPEVSTSVVIATADRPRGLAATLRSLEGCDPPAGVTSIHVVVADNGSNSETRKISERDYAGLDTDYLSVDRRGKTVAQNRAVEATDADLLVFTDDDVEFEPTWMAELSRAAREWPDHLLFGGRVDPIWPVAETPSYLEQSAYQGLLFTRVDRGDEEGPIPDFRPLGPNMAVRREAFDRGVRFDETIGPGSGGLSMGDELDIAFQLERLGQTAVYVPSSRVFHHVREEQLSLPWLLRRGLDYGRMTAHFDRGEAAPTVLGVPRWVYRAVSERCAEAVWSLARGRRKAAFDALMQATFAVGSARQHVSTRDRS